jgi:hypothetical protein
MYRSFIVQKTGLLNVALRLELVLLLHVILELCVEIIWSYFLASCAAAPLFLSSVYALV